jgi:hypothetical protein
MKAYVESKQLRLVGKAWEIKHYLKKLSRSEITLQEYLQTLNGVRDRQEHGRPKLTIVK